MKPGDWICSKRNPHYGGIVQSVKDHYVTVHCSDGLQTLHANYIRLGKPEGATAGIPADRKGAYQWFLDTFTKTREHQLWTKGGSMQQWQGFCDFFGWLQKHEPTRI